MDAIELALMTGMRKGELSGLEWARVDLRQRLVYFFQAHQQKNRKLGSLPLNDQARQVLLRRTNFRASPHQSLSRCALGIFRPGRRADCTD